MKILLITPEDNLYNSDINSIELEKYYLKLEVNDDIDKRLNEKVKILDEKEFDVIFIKESLGPNYLDFTGIRLAWYLRLNSQKHKNKPIVILSNFDGVLIRKLSFLGSILFAQGVYLENEITEKTFLPLQDYENFFNALYIPLPKEYNSNHDLANDWAMYVWSKSFDVNLNDLFEKFENELYFHYLKAKYALHIKKEKLRFKNENLKILAIDDNIVWGKIYQKLNVDFYHINNCKFEKIDIENYDLLILDLRLIKEDYYTKIPKCSLKLVKKFVKINPAVWIIIFSSSKNAEIIQEYKNYPNVIAYIKKNHPEDKETDILPSIEQFNSAFEFVRENKYLKEIWQLKIKIENTLNEIEIIDEEKINELKISNELVFSLLSCQSNKKFEYAMLAIYKMLEIIKDYFVKEEKYEYRKKELYVFNEKIDYQIKRVLEIPCQSR
jgi:hypothetical protein